MTTFNNIGNHIIKHAPFPIIISRFSDQSIYFINQKACDLFDISANDALNKRACDFYFNPNDRDFLMNRLNIEGSVNDFSAHMRSFSGREFYVYISSSLVTIDRAQYVISSFNDISKLKEISSKIESLSTRLSLATKSANIGIWEYDIKTESLFWDDEMMSIYGITPNEFCQTINSWTKKLFTEDKDEERKYFIDTIEQKLDYDREYRIISNERIKYIKSHGAFIENENKIVGISYDITERRLRENELEAKNRLLEEANNILKLQSITDSMTNILNHRFILETLNVELEKSVLFKTPLSIIMFDLDHFKKVNDTYGHLAGDEVLTAVAKVFKENLRSIDYVGRYGGEEFLVILPQTDLRGAFVIGDRIRLAIESLSVSELKIKVTISGGVATFKNQGLQGILQESDKNLYEAKNSGRNRISG